MYMLQNAVKNSQKKVRFPLKKILMNIRGAFNVESHECQDVISEIDPGEMLGT